MSKEQSPRVAAEVAALKAYGNASRQIGEINTPDKAKQLRQAQIAYAEAIDKLNNSNRAEDFRKLFKSLKLEF